jgi:peptidyl-Lys metalloendopeptidase
MVDETWMKVGEIALDRTPGSVIELPLNNLPICPNMSNEQFRASLLKLRDEAVRLIELRWFALATLWTEKSEKPRFRLWFGSTDDALRQEVLTNLAKLSALMKSLKPENIVRNDPNSERVLGCIPANDGRESGTAAHVCAPDTTTHTIAIHDLFCTLPDVPQGKMDSKLGTLIHECSHFADTFASIDYKRLYYGEFMARRLAQEDPKIAITNADNITWYVTWSGQ